MTLVGISGYARAGKDATGTILVNKFGFNRMAFADALKEVALGLDPIINAFPSTHWDDEGTPKNLSISTQRLSQVIADLGPEAAKGVPEVRRTYQLLGTTLRAVMPNIWVDIVKNRIGESEGGDFVITDVRFPNEVAMIDALGGEVWRIDRPGVGPATAPDGSVHISETGIDDYDFDVRINNCGGLNELAAVVSELIR